MEKKRGKMQDRENFNQFLENLFCNYRDQIVEEIVKYICDNPSTLTLNERDVEFCIKMAGGKGLSIISARVLSIAISEWRSRNNK